jgi:hypothetical protein
VSSLLFSQLGVLQLAATFVSIVLVVAILGAFATLFIVAVSNRSDPDPTGSRPMGAYLFSAAFLLLWVAYLGIDVAANSLINLLGNHPSPFPGVPGPSFRDDAIRACVLGGLLVVLAGGAMVLHLRRGVGLAEAEGNPTGPTKRVMRTYVALVSFVSVLILVLALVVAGWLVAGLCSPTIFVAGASRTVTTRELLDALVLVLLSGSIFSYHQRYAPEGLRLLSSISPPRHAAPSTPAGA